MLVVSQSEASALFIPYIQQKGKIYKKSVVVQARPAIIGEIIVTITKDGKETQNTALDSCMVVANPGGELYIISDEKFFSRYVLFEGAVTAIAPPDEKGIWTHYQAKGGCTAAVFDSAALGLSNPFYFMASWGEETVIKDGDMIATIDGKEVYRIAAQEFSETYDLVGKIKTKLEDLQKYLEFGTIALRTENNYHTVRITFEDRIDAERVFDLLSNLGGEKNEN